uniref:C2H2-type domain-containing protein n=1 Tax=Oryzias latipes TaxID=8090 RepID=A0A3B3HQV0_ORYLA
IFITSLHTIKSLEQYSSIDLNSVLLPSVSLLLYVIMSPKLSSKQGHENRQVLPEHGPAFQAPSSHGDRVIISGDQLPVEPSTEYQFPLLKKPYTCSTCEKVFQYASTLRSHLRSHLVEKPYACKTCGKNSNLKVHMRIHTGEKPYSCQTCGRAFSNQGHLRYHTKIHTGKAQNPVKKLHSCETCGKTYTSRASLVIHVRTHTGEKPFSCKMCGKRFSRSANCKIHMRIHTGEKPYCCKICEKCFTNKAHLRSHMKGLSPYQPSYPAIIRSWGRNSEIALE